MKKQSEVAKAIEWIGWCILWGLIINSCSVQTRNIKIDIADRECSQSQPEKDGDKFFNLERGQKLPFTESK